VSDYTRRLREKYDEKIRLHNNLDILGKDKFAVENEKRYVENDLNSKITYENTRNDDLDKIIDIKNNEICNISNQRDAYLKD
jgi:hypothetical protein